MNAESGETEENSDSGLFQEITTAFKFVRYNLKRLHSSHECYC